MVTAVVMIGEGGGKTEPLAWIQGARRAAAADLIEQLIRQPGIKRLIVATPELDGLVNGTDGDVVVHYRTDPGSIHFGQTLEEIGRKFRLDKLLYFGGGAAPLLSNEILRVVIEQLDQATDIVLTNNLFASDWAGIAPVTAIAYRQNRLPQDNMLGWVLTQEVGLSGRDWPASSETRLDIDTPADLLTLRLHPRTQPALQRYLNSIPLDTSRLERAINVLATPGSQVFLSGRVGPEAWHALNKVTSCWLRVVSEERGMVSSGRRAAGHVYSLLADHIDLVGTTPFYTRLGQICQAGLIDSRVLLAHHRYWPPASDRYASDLGFADQIADPWLRAFTIASIEAPLPIILGGHGLLNGDLLAICDLL